MSDQEGKSGPLLPSTVKPPFDPEQFARETDSRIRLESAPPSGRPTAPPPSPVLPLASSSDVPVLAITRDDLEWFDLTPPARDLLRQVNGRDTVEALANLLHRSTEQLLGELSDLAREGLITWR